MDASPLRPLDPLGNEGLGNEDSMLEYHGMWGMEPHGARDHVYICRYISLYLYSGRLKPPCFKGWKW